MDSGPPGPLGPARLLQANLLKSGSTTVNSYCSRVYSISSRPVDLFLVVLE